MHNNKIVHHRASLPYYSYTNSFHAKSLGKIPTEQKKFGQFSTIFSYILETLQDSHDSCYVMPLKMRT